jgi:hypothetical protein
MLLVLVPVLLLLPHNNNALAGTAEHSHPGTPAASAAIIITIITCSSSSSSSSAGGNSTAQPLTHYSLELRAQLQERVWLGQRVIQREASPPAGPLPSCIQLPLLAIQPHISVTEVWAVLLLQGLQQGATFCFVAELVVWSAWPQGRQLVCNAVG